jgi:hypothetical protein
MIFLLYPSLRRLQTALTQLKIPLLVQYENVLLKAVFGTSKDNKTRLNSNGKTSFQQN